MPQTYELNLRDYLRILRKRYRVIAGLMVLCGLATLFFAPQPKVVFEAESTAKVVHQSTVADLVLESVTWNYGDDLQTQSQIIGSLPMALKIGQRMGRFPQEMKAIDLSNSEELSAQVAAFSGFYRAEPVSGTSLVRIIARSDSPEFSMRLVNVAVDTFLEEHTYERNRQIIDSRRFIESQLIEYEVRLRQSEDALTAYTSSHLSELSLAPDQMARLNEQFENYNLQIRALENLTDTLEARLVSPQKTYVDILDGEGGGTAVEELNQELVRLQFERERRLVAQRESSPEIIAIEGQIKVLARQLLVTYQRKLVHLVPLRDELAIKLESLPQNDSALGRLARDVKVNADTYTLLKQRHQEALIKEAEKIQEVTVVEYAAEATSDSGPGRVTRSLAGLAVGLMLGLLMAFLLETLDTSLDTIEEVEEYLGVSVIGIVPHFEIQETQTRLLKSKPELVDNHYLHEYSSVVARHEKQSVAAEAYRSVRTNLEFAQLRKLTQKADGAASVIMLTSSQPGEGKTTTTVNLAVVLAQSGKRVLLLDCDLRNPHVNMHFGVDRDRGFTDVLLGAISLDESIRSGMDIALGEEDMLDDLASEGLDGLHMITSGTLPSHPAEILGSSRFDQMLDRLKSKFDIILIDVPPVLPVTDATILGGKVDGVILVHALGKVSRNALRRAKTMLDNVDAKQMGIVLNNIRVNLTGYPVQRYYAQSDDEETGRALPIVTQGQTRKALSWLDSLRTHFGFKQNGNGNNHDKDQPSSGPGA